MIASREVVNGRAQAALKLLYVADALSMPVHWFYNPLDILKAFPGGIKRFEAPPAVHPTSIMALHSTNKGGRGNQPNLGEPQVVGDIILKGKRRYWGIASQHYHQGMRAGENTLNAHCARLVSRVLIANKGRYRAEDFVQQYIAFMTADPAQHPDTYAESYHRAFFAQYAKGVAPLKCGQKTHDTPSVGGLVTVAPIAISEFMRNTSLAQVQAICRAHVFITHPDEHLGDIVAAYVGLIHALLLRDGTPVRELIAATARAFAGLNLDQLMQRTLADSQVVGGLYSKACYIDDSWPSLLFLLYKYCDHPLQGMLANTNLGGENCHRGSVLGVLLGLASADDCADFFAQLVAASEIQTEINELLACDN